MDPSANPPPAGARRSRRGVWVVVIVAVLIVAGSITAYQTRHQFIPKNFAAVEPGRVFRSGQISPRMIEPTLRDNGIQVVINMLSEDMSDPDQAAEARVCSQLGVTTLRFPMAGDGTGDPAMYVGAVTAMVAAGREGKVVLVHCAAGAQRTGGTIYLYRTLVQRKSAADAYAELLDAGHDPRRNPKLTAFLNQHMATIAQALKANGAIADVPDPLPMLPAK